MIDKCGILTIFADYNIYKCNEKGKSENNK